MHHSFHTSLVLVADVGRQQFPDKLLVSGHDGPLHNLMGSYVRIPGDSVSWRLTGRLFRHFSDVRLYFARQHNAWIVGVSVDASVALPPNQHLTQTVVRCQAKEHMAQGVGWLISGNPECNEATGPLHSQALYVSRSHGLDCVNNFNCCIVDGIVGTGLMVKIGITMRN